MIGLFFLFAIIVCVLVAVKSHESTWKKVVGAILLFFATICLGIGFSGGGLPWYIHIFAVTALTMGGVQLTFPYKPVQLSALALVVLSCATYQPIKNKADKVRAAELFAYNRFKTVDNVRNNIEGTEWTYMKQFEGTGDYWHRLSFKNGVVYHYEVFPSDGEWGEPKVYSYTVVEGRYANTGQKYIGLEWEGSLGGKWTFIPADEQLGVTYGERPIVLKMEEGYRDWPD